LLVVIWNYITMHGHMNIKHPNNACWSFRKSVLRVEPITVSSFGYANSPLWNAEQMAR